MSETWESNPDYLLDGIEKEALQSDFQGEIPNIWSTVKEGETAFLTRPDDPFEVMQQRILDHKQEECAIVDELRDQAEEVATAQDMLDTTTVAKKASMEKRSYVRQCGEKWCVYSKAGKKLGEHPSREDAVKQLRAIEVNKQAAGPNVEKITSLTNRIYTGAASNIGSAWNYEDALSYVLESMENANYSIGGRRGTRINVRNPATRAIVEEALRKYFPNRGAKTASGHDHCTRTICDGCGKQITCRCSTPKTNTVHVASCFNCKTSAGSKTAAMDSDPTIQLLEIAQKKFDNSSAREEPRSMPGAITDNGDGTLTITFYVEDRGMQFNCQVQVKSLDDSNFELVSPLDYTCDDVSESILEEGSVVTADELMQAWFGVNSDVEASLKTAYDIDDDAEHEMENQLIPDEPYQDTFQQLDNDAPLWADDKDGVNEPISGFGFEEQSDPADISDDFVSSDNEFDPTKTYPSGEELHQVEKPKGPFTDMRRTIQDHKEEGDAIRAEVDDQAEEVMGLIDDFLAAGKEAAAEVDPQPKHKCCEELRVDKASKGMKVMTPHGPGKVEDVWEDGVTVTVKLLPSEELRPFRTNRLQKMASDQDKHKCPRCHKAFDLDVSGKLPVHYVGGSKCSGSNQKIVDFVPFPKRAALLRYWPEAGNNDGAAIEIEGEPDELGQIMEHLDLFGDPESASPAELSRVDNGMSGEDYDAVIPEATIPDEDLLGDEDQVKLSWKTENAQ